MSTAINSSPAFPSPGVVLPNGQQQGAYEGMALRDYFAAKALPAFVGMGHDELQEATAEYMEGFDTWSLVAMAAYQVADAMLAARQGGAA